MMDTRCQASPAMQASDAKLIIKASATIVVCSKKHKKLASTQVRACKVAENTPCIVLLMHAYIFFNWCVHSKN